MVQSDICKVICDCSGHPVWLLVFHSEKLGCSSDPYVLCLKFFNSTTQLNLTLGHYIPAIVNEYLGLNSVTETSGTF